MPFTDDPSKAAKRIMTDDGFNTGILYRGDRPAYQLQARRAAGDADSLSAEFVV